MGLAGSNHAREIAFDSPLLANGSSDSGSAEVIASTSSQAGPAKSEAEAMPELSQEELACILGNARPQLTNPGVSDKELTKAVYERFPENGSRRHQQTSPEGKHLERPVSDLGRVRVEMQEELAKVQEEFLEFLRTGDSEVALKAVLAAPMLVVNFNDECSGNALLCCAAEGHVTACKALLDRADFHGVNATNSIGSTALHLAAANDEDAICRAILACPRFMGGVNILNNNGQSPMDFAVEFGTGLCTSLLQEFGGKSVCLRRRGGNHYGGRHSMFGGAPLQNEEVQDMNELD